MVRPAAIAIDGPVAAGKTVVGKLVARRLGYRFLDTGSMYRAVTWAAIGRGVSTADQGALGALSRAIDIQLDPSEDGGRLLVDGEDITDQLRSPEVEKGVSPVSRVSGVRRAMVDQQRRLAEAGPIVMVGRDIGTVVLHDAKVKVFLTASAEVRAGRRYEELTAQGKKADLDKVADALTSRDEMDSSRADSPLRPASDAIVVDTDDLSVEGLADRILSLVDSNKKQ